MHIDPGNTQQMVAAMCNKAPRQSTDSIVGWPIAMIGLDRKQLIKTKDPRVAKRFTPNEAPQSPISNLEAAIILPV